MKVPDEPRRDRFACKHVAAGAEMKAYLLLDVHSFVGVRMCAECREQVVPQLVRDDGSALCQCGHTQREHGAQFCTVLGCACRAFGVHADG